MPLSEAIEEVRQGTAREQADRDREDRRPPPERAKYATIQTIATIESAITITWLSRNWPNAMPVFHVFVKWKNGSTSNGSFGVNESRAIFFVT